MAVDHRRRVGLVGAQYEVERVAHRSHRGILEAVLAVDGRVPGREQQRVAVAQGDVEALGQAQHHLRARARAPGLDEAQVARRDAGLERQVELAQAPP